MKQELLDPKADPKVEFHTHEVRKQSFIKNTKMWRWNSRTSRIRSVYLETGGHKRMIVFVVLLFKAKLPYFLVLSLPWGTLWSPAAGIFEVQANTEKKKYLQSRGWHLV